MTLLSVDIRHSFATGAERRDPDVEAGFMLDVHFHSDAHAIALAGPSGAGKSTILNIIAGVVKPDAARIVVGGETLIDTAVGIALPMAKRRVGYVFQDGRLFPHLTVRQNLLFGRWFARRHRDAISFEEVAELLDIVPLLQRRPAALSGGEKQRVAIGRALLARPRLLLLDEPLTSLDAARRQQIMPLIERIRDELLVPIVFVSHDPVEVVRIGMDVVQIEKGRVVPVGKEAQSKITRLDAYRGQHLAPNSISGK